MNHLSIAQRRLALSSLLVAATLAGCKSASTNYSAAKLQSRPMPAASGFSNAQTSRTKHQPSDVGSRSDEQTRATRVSMVAYRKQHGSENESVETNAVIPVSQVEPVDSQAVSGQSTGLAEVVVDPLASSAAQSTAQSSGLSYSLQDAIATSLTQNPDLIAARGQEQVSNAAVGVAETYIWNPFVQAQIRPSDGQGGQSNYYLWLMQRFELAHQQRFREQSAYSLLNQVRWTIHQSELTNIATTSQLYFTALYQRELHDLAHQTAKLNDDLLGIIERRVKAGVGTAPQLTTAKVAARQSKNQAYLADTNYQTALLALRRQLNFSSDEPLVLTDRLPSFDWHPASEFACGEVQIEASGAAGIQQLATAFAEGRPDVMAALAGVNATCANAQLARAAQRPDVQAGPILDKNANGSYDVGVRLQRDLFVMNNGRPLTRQRNAEWQQQNRVYTQLKTRAAREAETALDRYERARLLAAETKVDLSPFNEKMPADLKDINSQFQAGQADVLIVYATQNALLQDRRTYLDSLNELALSAAAVVQATALPVERIVSVADGQKSL